MRPATTRSGQAVSRLDSARAQERSESPRRSQPGLRRHAGNDVLSQGCRQSASEYGPNLIYDYAVARGDQELADFVNAWIELKQKDGMTARLYDYGFWD